MTRWEKKLAATKRRKELRERAVAYLGGKCSICSYDKCASAFDFHHVEVWLKDFTISDRMTSWERIEPELKKVVLLCARCHREVHDPFPGVKSLRDPNVTLEQVRVAMETEDALAKSFNVPVTMLDLLAPLD